MTTETHAIELDPSICASAVTVPASPFPAAPPPVSFSADVGLQVEAVVADAESPVWFARGPTGDRRRAHPAPVVPA